MPEDQPNALKYSGLDAVDGSSGRRVSAMDLGADRAPKI